MKKNNKNQFIIYAISLMLVAAGYFNYITFDNKVQETYSEDLKPETYEETSNVGDAVLVNNNEIIEENSNSQSENNNKSEENQNSKFKNNNKSEENDNEKKEEENNENNKVEKKEKETVNEQEDYFVSSKLDREKMYANMLTNYEAILNKTNCSEAQKTIATQEITKINNTKNAIMICENLLNIKGFTNCVILVNEESVNIVIGTKEKLQPDKVAIIQNIISREMKKEITNIHITEKIG